MTRRFLSVLFSIVACCGLAAAQQKPAKAPAAAPAVSESVNYLLPTEDHSKIRDLQVEYDLIEIDTQKMLVKIEQNKARQAMLVDSMKVIAFQFAEAKHIDLNIFELDNKEIKFMKRGSK